MRGSASRQLAEAAGAGTAARQLPAEPRSRDGAACARRRASDHDPFGDAFRDAFRDAFCKRLELGVGDTACARADPRELAAEEAAARAEAVSRYALKRVSGDALALTEEHEAIARPRKGEIHWEAFDASAYADAELDAAAELWQDRAVQEMHSLALFTELASKLHLLGAPLDWSGAFARMIADEVRHTDLCLRMCGALGRPAAPEIDPAKLHLMTDASPRTHVRRTVVAAFCIGETISGHMFRQALKAATVPLAREVVTAIVVDETFHGELGWELGALLMRKDAAHEAERAQLASDLPGLFRHYARLCCAAPGRAWAWREPAVEDGPNFGTMTHAGYARAFFEAMESDVVPGLVAIGLPEAKAAYDALLDAEPARTL